jgi:hypothetical protein
MAATLRFKRGGGRCGLRKERTMWWSRVELLRCVGSACGFGTESGGA